MFTWICPQCGREVSPVYTECPDCAAKAKENPPAPPAANAGSPLGPAAPPQVALPPQPPPSYAPPQQYAPPPQFQQQPPAQPVYQAPAQPVYQAPPQPVYQQPQMPQYAVAPRPAINLPTWLLTILFALAFLGLVAGIYWIVGYFHSGSQAASTPAPTVESPAAKPGAPTNPIQKYVEISGVRFTEDGKKNIQVKFLLTNHSDADIQGLAGNATLFGKTQKSEEDTVGTFAFTTDDVPPQASKELTAPLTTELKIYELPDWQNVSTDIQITAPH